MPKRLMLDTNVYDLIVARRGFGEKLNRAVVADEIEILRTRVQEEEIARIENASKRAAMRQVRGRTIPISDAPWQGLPKGASPSEDALIVATAEESADVLVTGDKDLALKAKAGGRVEVWRFEELVAFVEALWGLDVRA